MNRYLDDLGRRFQAVAASRRADIDAPTLDPSLAEELLELARVAAHSQERRFAPLACYLAGVAAERYRNESGAGPREQSSLIEQVRTQLEAEAPSPEGA